MKKIFSILVLLLIVGIITGCGKTVTEPETPTTTDTVVDSGLDDVTGEIDDFGDISDDDLGDIDLDEDLPPL